MQYDKKIRQIALKQPQTTLILSLAIFVFNKNLFLQNSNLWFSYDKNEFFHMNFFRPIY